MLFDPQYLTHLRQRTVLSEIIGKYVRLRAYGKEHKGLCPFHQEKSPSFTVNDTKGFFHCFGCAAHGDAVDFLIKEGNRSFSEAVKELAEQLGIPLPTTPGPQSFSGENAKSIPSDSEALYLALEKATCWFENQLRNTTEGKKAYRYLEDRGVSLDACQRFRLGWAPKLSHARPLHDYLHTQGIPLEHMAQAGLIASKDESRNQNQAVYDRFRGRLIFPIVNEQGRVIAFGGRLLEKGTPKYLNSPETPLFSKSHHGYGLWQAKRPELASKPMIIVEGYLDVIALQEKAIARAVAPLGTTLGTEQLTKIWRREPEPYVCFDGDLAGHVAGRRTAEHILPLLKPGFSLKFIHLPDGEDPDSLAQENNPKIFDSLFANAQNLVDKLWCDTQESTATTTPEQKALFKQRLSKLTNQIRHTDVRALYHQAFHEKCEIKFSQKRIGDVATKKHTRHTDTGYRSHQILKPSSGTTLHLDALRLQRRILFAALGNYPEILNHVLESFVELSLPPGKLHQLRSIILEWESQRASHPTPEMLKDFVLAHNLGELFTFILSPETYAHAEFARPGQKDIQVVQEGWYEVFNRHQNRIHMLPELKEAKQRFQGHMSESLWTRLRYLTEFNS